MPRRCLGRAVVGGVLLAFSLSCHSKDLSDEVSTVTSWAETVRLAGEAWVHGEIPTAYTRRTFEVADQKIEEEQKELAQSPPLASRTRELRQALKEARSAVTREDRTAVAAPLDRISAVEQALRSLGEEKGGA